MPSPKTPTELGYRLPAEWEPHRATWMAWPHPARDWPGKSGAIPWVLAELARHLTPREKVCLLVPSARVEARALRVLERAGARLDQVELFRCATDRTWARDFLPCFVVGGAGRRAALGGVKWRFDGWARWKPYARDDRAGRRVAERVCSRVWFPEARFGGKRRPVVLEGGAIDTDGAGTLLATEECLAGARYGRNPGLGRDATEAVLRDHLGARRVLWLPRGIEGDDTTGHIDAVARFVSRGRVVLCREPNRRDSNHRRLEENRERLEGAKDARGRRLEVVRIPMPEPAYDGKLRLAATYANFLIANGVVLVPTFNDPLDRTALGLFAELFPKRRVIGIHARDLLLGGGTVHCTTMQEPLVS